MQIAQDPTRLPIAFSGDEPLPPRAFEQLVQCRVAIKEFRLLDAREAVEAALEANPDSFIMNAIHGEVLYRLGMYKPACAALFRAMLQPPTSWKAYQVVSLLYQEARSNDRGSFDRATNVPPPKPIANAIYWVARRLSFLSRFRRLEATG